MDADDRANEILGRIRKVAEGYRGKLLLTVDDAGKSGKGYVSLPNMTGIVFDFFFRSSGFNIKFHGFEALSGSDDIVDYSNEAEIISLIKIIEKRIKILIKE